MPSLGTLGEAPRLVELPHKPEWFDKELADIAKIGGQPLFKIVDGQRELVWRNGRMDVKHLLQDDNQACYVRIQRQIWQRQNLRTREYKVYQSKEEAKLDLTPKLSKFIEPKLNIEVRAVGKPCWVIETLVPAKDLSREAWDACRFQTYFSVRGEERVDVHGEYPNEGKYIHCLDVVDDEGNAVEPGRALLESLKKRLHLYERDKRSARQAFLDDIDKTRKFEEKQVKVMTENFYQKHGLAAMTKYHNVAVGKPIILKD
jgi:hypothetical protein